MNLATRMNPIVGVQTIPSTAAIGGVLDIDVIEYGGYSELEQSMTRWLVWGKLTCNFPEGAVKSRPEFVGRTT